MLDTKMDFGSKTVTGVSAHVGMSTVIANQHINVWCMEIGCQVVVAQVSQGHLHVFTGVR